MIRTYFCTGEQIFAVVMPFILRETIWPVEARNGVHYVITLTLA